jgi:hypothetical protein
MKIVLIGLVLLLALGAAAALLARRRRQDPEAGPPPAYRRRDFLSKTERSFYRVLQQAVGRGGVVFAKVRLADLLTPAGGIGNQGYQAAFNRISAKHVDFVICGPEDVVPRVAIELDDATQRQARRQERDAFIDAACHSADLPLLRISAQRDYGAQQLRTELAEYLDPEPKGPRTQELPPQPSLAPPAPAAGNPACPKCGAAMEKRTGKSGPLAGKDFWGCSSFPRCHGMLPVALAG